MQKERNAPVLGLALAAALVALPAQLVAQDRPQQQQQQQQQQQTCTAQIMPAQVEAGSNAERVMVTLNQPVGEITGVEAAEGSNIELASAADLPRTPLASGDQPRVGGDQPSVGDQPRPGGDQPRAGGDQPRAGGDQPQAGAGQPRPQPISSGDAENQWVVYLNLSEAEAGAHELTFNTRQGQCTGRIMVQ